MHTDGSLVGRRGWGIQFPAIPSESGGAFIGIADGMNRVPTKWMQHWHWQSVARDVERLSPKLDSDFDPSTFERVFANIPAVRVGVVCAKGFTFDSPANSANALMLRGAAAELGVSGGECGKGRTGNKEEKKMDSVFARCVHPVFHLSVGDLNMLGRVCGA